MHWHVGMWPSLHGEWTCTVTDLTRGQGQGQRQSAQLWRTLTLKPLPTLHRLLDTRVTSTVLMACR
jgi:hypothetical protein